MTADEFLDALVARLHATPEPDPDLILDIGCGDLENLISADGDYLWPRIERLARDDMRFRRALSSVWAYDSPEYERRKALLVELGESRPVHVTFIVEAEDFAAAPRVGWRAVQIEGDPPGRQLGRLLREVADWYDRQPLSDNPEVVRDRTAHGRYLEWSRAANAVERMWHQVAVAPDKASLRAVLDTAEPLRRQEAALWRTFVSAATADATDL